MWANWRDTDESGVATVSGGTLQLAKNVGSLLLSESQRKILTLAKSSFRVYPCGFLDVDSTRILVGQIKLIFARAWDLSNQPGFPAPALALLITQS